MVLFKAFYRQEHLDYMCKHDQSMCNDEWQHARQPEAAFSGVEQAGFMLTGQDSRILRMSIAAGEDLTPLLHFWGAHPVEPTKLAEQVQLHNLPYSSTTKELLLRYQKLIPATNAAFYAHFAAVYPHLPTGGNPNYSYGWYNVWNGKWAEVHHTAASTV